MSLISEAIHRIRRDYFRWKYSQVARQVLNTGPLQAGELPFLLLSMVHKRDIHSYLVAVKSFTRFANPRRIVVVCDPSIGEVERDVLKKHVPHLELRSADEFTHAKIPRGGTWERLFAIAQYVTDNYVVQLDADTVTVKAIPEVLKAIHEGYGFVLSESSTTQLRPIHEISEVAQRRVHSRSHIQTISEAAMATVGCRNDALYVRGCSGFTGFPSSASMQEEMLEFSGLMSAKLGSDWMRWGTEQVSSNYLVANANGTIALPFPKYGTPDMATEDSAFLHFIGSMRFVNNQYEKTSRKALQLIIPIST